MPGGADEIVRDHVRRAVDELADEDRDLAAEVFRYLVTPSGAKIAYTVSDLAGLTGADPDRLERLAGVLSRRTRGSARPVGVLGSRDVESGVEIYHDKLARSDPRLARGAPRAARPRERSGGGTERAQIEKEEAERERKRRLRRIGLIAGLAALLILLFLGFSCFSSSIATTSWSVPAAWPTRPPSSSTGIRLSVLLAKEAVEEDSRRRPWRLCVPRWWSRACAACSRPQAGPDLNSMALAPTVAPS